MDPASLGRRRLEEIRQKKAQAKQAESNEQDLEALKIEFGAAQKENSALQKQLDESMQQVELLTRQLHDAQAQANSEANLVADLKQSLKTLSVERDAAIMAKEDLLTQLRLTRKRLQEAEDEQYKAEEDAAVLRAELKHLQHMEHSMSSQSLQSQFINQYGVSEEELRSLKEELQNTIYQLQQQQRFLASEEQKVMKLEAEKKELELALESARKKETEARQSAAKASHATNEASVENKWRSKVDRGKYEQHVRELASMVERLENGRQKLLAEIDMQSLEIEKLFMENAGLVNGLNETSEIAARWERQARETMKQNAELRHTLEEVKAQQPAADLVKDTEEGDSTEKNQLELSKLKMHLTRALGERDQLNAQISQLSLELESARHKLNGFSRLYIPVLSSIETRLLQMKQNPLQIDVTF